MKLSIVMAGRDPNYAGNLRERMLAAVTRNQAEAAARNLNIEWIFSEWNPPSDDYLSYDLAKLGFNCYITNPEIHDELVHPELKDNYFFMEVFAKNVGIRRATGDWILVTNLDDVFDAGVWDYLAREVLDSNTLYRAERADISWELFSKPFTVMEKNIILVHNTKGGTRVTNAAGDFMLFSASKSFGLDEQMIDTNVYSDNRFCLNWLKLGGDYKFIGRVYKADHPLIYANTKKEDVTHKGFKKTKSVKPCKEVATYINKDNWGLIDVPQVKLCERIWYLG